ncbi:MAG: hypothetical protein A2854_00445 [Parcubacteria group bacterium RIFCSPHIGHO2_01_FULL_56_18]|nr:MAG: hypothetical protein A2854_00445 [Parcubacteria group bacterium RIFCSPHIGHO2_01_FULL_56_18]
MEEVPGEKGYNYYKEHPEELTVENFPTGPGFSFLNNFWAKVLYVDDSSEQWGNESLKAQIKQAIEEENFNFEEYRLLQEERSSAMQELVDILNERAKGKEERIDLFQKSPFPCRMGLCTHK